MRRSLQTVLATFALALLGSPAKADPPAGPSPPVAEITFRQDSGGSTASYRLPITANGRSRLRLDGVDVEVGVDKEATGAPVLRFTVERALDPHSGPASLHLDGAVPLADTPTPLIIGQEREDGRSRVEVDLTIHGTGR